MDTCEIQNCCVYYQQADSIVFEGGVDRQPEIQKSNHTLMINRKEKYFMAGCYVDFSYNVGLGKIKELANIENKHSTKSWDVLLFSIAMEYL